MCGSFYKTEYGQRIDLKRGGDQNYANLGSENSRRWRAFFPLKCRYATGFCEIIKIWLGAPLKHTYIVPIAVVELVHRHSVTNYY